MVEGTTQLINAAAVAGPLVLLSLVILVLAGVAGFGIWKFAPIIDTALNKIPLAINENKKTVEEVKAQVTTSNQVSQANANAIGDLANNSANSQSVVEQLVETTKSLNQAMEKSIEFERNRHLSLIGGISQVVTSVGDMSKVLQKDIEELHTLIETRPKAMDENEVGWFRSNVEVIRDCVLRIEAKLVPIPLVETPAPAIEAPAQPTVGNPQPEAAVQPIELVKEVQP